MFAIFADAAIGHGLLWENDPYWTYWVTKTFLIATVFGLGTAWIGLGIGRGAAITAVHTLVLTVYYWSLSPIGIPSSPEWLDLEHTWITGLPVHFGVIYLGYLVALWLWRRRAATANSAATSDAGGEATRALVTSLGIVVIGGGAAALAVGDFPGVTWFVVRLLLTVPFVLAWWALAGRDRIASVLGGTTLAFMWATYGHFLGPSGLPDLPLRIFEQTAAPEATVTWMSYREVWLISFPIYTVVSVLVFLIATRNEAQIGLREKATRTLSAATVAVALVALVLGVTAFTTNDAHGDIAEVTASGEVQIEGGTWYGDEFESGNASIDLYVQDRAARVTPLPPHDLVDLSATVEHPDGTSYEIAATDPMVSDPLGRHTTWWGVGLHHTHHGRSGIGTDLLPPIHSEIAVFALGEVSVAGEVIAAGVPIHVMTAEEGLPGRLELDVGDPAFAIPGLPDGHLRVVWDEYSGGAGQGPKRARNTLGSAVLLGLLGLMLLANKDGKDNA